MQKFDPMHIANGRRQRAFMQKGNIDGSRFQYLARVLIDLATAIAAAVLIRLLAEVGKREKETLWIAFSP